MFVQDFVIVDQPSEAVAQALEHGGAGLLGAALRLSGDGQPLQAKVGPASWPALLTKTVEVNVGVLRRYDDTVLMAFSWHAAGGPSLFPALDGDLEIGPIGEHQAAITLRGHYEPPGGIVGRSIDRLLLHRLAAATVRAFLSEVARNVSSQRKALQGEPSEPAASPAPPRQDPVGGVEGLPEVP